MDAHVADDQKNLRAALLNQYNLILLCGAAAFAVALASFTPLLVGLVGEALWLVVAPRIAGSRASAGARVGGVPPARERGELPPEYAQRVASVERAAAEIEALCASRGDMTPAQRHEVSRRLSASVEVFDAVCATEQRLRRLTAHVPLAELRGEVAALQRALEGETDLGVRASHRRAINAAERRIKQQESQEGAARALELAVANLQRSLVVLREGAAGVSTGDELCAVAAAASADLVRAATLEATRETELSLPRMSAPPPALT